MATASPSPDHVDQSCGNCRYWLQTNETGDRRTTRTSLPPPANGRCRRFPPFPADDRIYPSRPTRHPLTRIESWWRGMGCRQPSLRRATTNKAETGEVPGNLHIEHIMPQTWHPNWPLPAAKSEDEEAVANRNRAIHMIGNLTLVNGRLNSSLSNAPWASKRKTLADHSVLFLNKRLVTRGPKSGTRPPSRSVPSGCTKGHENLAARERRHPWLTPTVESTALH